MQSSYGYKHVAHKHQQCTLSTTKKTLNSHQTFPSWGCGLGTRQQLRSKVTCVCVCVRVRVKNTIEKVNVYGSVILRQICSDSCTALQGKTRTDPLARYARGGVRFPHVPPRSCQNPSSTGSLGACPHERTLRETFPFFVTCRNAPAYAHAHAQLARCSMALARARVKATPKNYTIMHVTSQLCITLCRITTQ